MIKRGKGLAISYYGTGYGNGYPDVSNAIVRLNKDGKVSIFVGGTEVGQGAKTVFVQIAAETLNINIKDIILYSEDTINTPDSGTAAASRQTYNTGNAIKLACEKFIEELKAKAKEILNLDSTEGLIVSDSNVYLNSSKNEKVSFLEIASSLKNGFIESQASFTAHTVEMDVETGQGEPYWPYTFSACEVEVEVNTLTGIVNIVHARFAQDVGKAVNPRMIEGQIDGGFYMGQSYCLFEDLNIVDGKIMNNKYSKYLLPTSMDTIDIDKIIIEDPESTAPFGAKGIGEPVTIPVAPAILNAIYDAINVRINELPATPDKIISALKKVKSEDQL